MTNVRNPRLDSLLSGTAVLSSDDAHRAARELFSTNAPLRPLRNPELDEQLRLACHEFDNPGYVDAIVRNMAAQDPQDIYSRSQYACLGRTYVDDIELDRASMASMADGILRETDHVAHAVLRSTQTESEVTGLVRHARAFLSPFTRVANRMRCLPSAGDGDKRPARRKRRLSSAKPMIDYRWVAESISLPQRASTYLLLRFCFLPVGRFVECTERHGAVYVEMIDDNPDEWLLLTLLDDDRYRHEEPMACMERLCEDVLHPLLCVGQKTCAPHTQTTLDLPMPFYVPF